MDCRDLVNKFQNVATISTVAFGLLYANWPQMTSGKKNQSGSESGLRCQGTASTNSSHFCHLKLSRNFFLITCWTDVGLPRGSGGHYDIFDILQINRDVQLSCMLIDTEK